MLRISVPGRGGNGSEGTSIWATIEARLLGLPLLTLDADVALVPAEVDVGGTSEGKQRNGSSDRRGTYDPPGARNGIGQAGHGLADAVRALEASSDDLQKAREQMP